MLYSLGLIYHILEETEGTGVYRLDPYTVETFMDDESKTFGELDYKMEFCTVSAHFKLLEEYELIEVTPLEVSDYPCSDYLIEEDCVTAKGSKIFYALKHGLAKEIPQKYQVRSESISKAIFEDVVKNICNK